MGDWKPREPVRLHGGPGLQLNWTQETGRLEGEGGRERRVRQEGRIRACASEEENFNWRQFVESPGGWNPPGSSRLLSFTRMTTLYTVTPLVFKPSTFVHPSLFLLSPIFPPFSPPSPSSTLRHPFLPLRSKRFYILNIMLKMKRCYIECFN